MSVAKKGEEFFVGYGAAPRGVSRYAIKVILVLLAGAFLISFALAWSVQERGGGGFGEALTVKGRVANLPYPAVQVFPTPDYPSGYVLLILGAGKTGMGPVVDKLKGKAVEVKGAHLKRGDLNMIVTNSMNNYKVIDENPKIAALKPESLGTFRIAGEICDGKCYAGGMRPGRGIAHRACANLCIAGEQPAVLATFRPIKGANFLMLADKDGNKPPKKMYDFVALPAVLEGELVRYGDLLVLKADWSKIKRQ